MPTHGVKKRRKKEKFPLIEIMGPIDCGKQVVGSLLARRLFGSYHRFPNQGIKTATGKDLLLKLNSTPHELENMPEWWANVSLANMQESAQLIKNALELGPVITSNYLLSWKIYFGALGIDTRRGIHSLPYPNLGFKLENTSLQFSEMLRTDTQFSMEFLMKLGRKFRSVQDNKIVSIVSEGSKFTHVEANKVTIEITDYISQKYKFVDVNPLELYTKDSFIPRGLK